MAQEFEAPQITPPTNQEWNSAKSQVAKLIQGDANNPKSLEQFIDTCPKLGLAQLIYSNESMKDFFRSANLPMEDREVAKQNLLKLQAAEKQLPHKGANVDWKTVSKNSGQYKENFFVSTVKEVAQAKAFDRDFRASPLFKELNKPIGEHTKPATGVHGNRQAAPVAPTITPPSVLPHHRPDPAPMNTPM